MDLINSKQVKYATVKSVIILGGMVAHISSPMSALQRHVSYTLTCVDELMESEQRLLSPCFLRCDARTIFCHVMVCNADA